MTESAFTISIVHRTQAEIMAAAAAGPRSRLTFDFLDNLAFPLPIEEIIDTYHQLLDQTTIKPVVKNAMLPLWLHGNLMSDHRLMRAAFAPLKDPEMTWHWPLFEEWRAKFRDQNLWPETWSMLEDKARDKRNALKVERADFLPQWVSFKIGARHNASNHRPDSFLSRWGWTLDSYGENNSKLVQGLSASVVLGEWMTYPPFFPGDQSSIRFNPRPKASVSAP